MEKRQLRPWMTVLFVIVFGGILFVAGGFLGRWFGMGGLFLQELFLAVAAVLLAAAFRADLRKVFPLRRVEAAKVGGTLLLWLGMFLVTMMITMTISYFFPQEVLGAGNEVGGIIAGLPVGTALFLIAFAPAVCEEVAFRGALLSCFRSAKSRWIGILVTAVIFGAFHGSVWRFVPTAILGAVMGYLLFETENMIYSMLFHFVNNAVPVLLAGAAQMASGFEMGAELQQAAQYHLPFAAVAAYWMYGSGAPFLLYIGNYLLHRGQPGYDRGLFPREKRGTLLVLAGISGFLFAAGLLILVGLMGAELQYGLSSR